MADRRGALPFALTGVLVALALGAGAVGLITGPSQAQIDLQIAAQQTAEAQNFSFASSVELGLSGPLPAESVQEDGVWQSPDRWRVVNMHNGASSVTTGMGSTMNVSGSDGGSLTFQLPSDALISFSDPNSPVLLLPPLGILYSATHVNRTGDVYDFVVPHLYLASGWVAYAPLSQHILPLPLILARDVHAEAVITGGYVMTLAFPHGIHTSQPRLTESVVWHISDIGSRSVHKAPNVG